MNKIFNAEEMLEAGKSGVQKQVSQQVSATTKIVGSQLAGSGTIETQDQGKNTQQVNLQDDSTNDFVKDLYGTSMQPNTQQPNTSGNHNLQNSKLPQSPEEAERLAKARKLLQEQHMSTYYKPTFEAQKREESVAERLEREEQEKQARKMEELKVEQKKNEVPLAVQLGAHKAEKFPGASG